MTTMTRRLLPLSDFAPIIQKDWQLVPVKEVILHCAAINTGQFAKFNAFQAYTTVHRWHREKGFAGFGYHGLIIPNGEFYAGRPVTMTGAHCKAKAKNVGSLGILLIESVKIDRIGHFDDWFTSAQAVTLNHLLDGLRKAGVTTLSGHNDHDNRLCPGFRVGESQFAENFNISPSIARTV